MANAPFQSKAWEAGLCGCFDDTGLCCDTCWCALCMTGNYYESLYNSRAYATNCPIACGCLVLGLGFYWVSPLIGNLPLMAFAWCMRSKTRGKYGIAGDCCQDFCASFWCSACVLCQVHREASKHSLSPGYCCCKPNIQYQPAVVAQNGYVQGQPSQGQPVQGQPGPYPKQQGGYPAPPPQQQGYPAPQQGGYPAPPPQQQGYPAPQQQPAYSVPPQQYHPQPVHGTAPPAEAV